jgi:Fic family protein
LLYLSLYLKSNRNRYYELLQMVRTEGVWEEWLRFFLEGVESTASQAAETAIQLRELFREDSQRIQAQAKSASTSLQIHSYLQVKPVASIGSIAAGVSKTVTTVAAVLANLQQLGIVTETTGRRRNRVFIYQRCLDLIGAGTEPLPRLR